MKITQVVCYVLRADIERPFYYSQGFYSSREAILIEVRTDDGLSGWGEAFGTVDSVPVEVERRYAPLVVGKDPSKWGPLWLCLGGLRGGHFGIISGLEIAILDLAGKIVGQPVHTLLGGAVRDRIQVYATGLYRLQRWQDIRVWQDGLVEEALKYRDAGFPAAKLKIGFDPHNDVRLVRAVRDAVGNEMGLAVDANGAWDAATAISVGRQLESARLLWYEEPVPPTDLDGYAEVRRAVTIPIAGGERLTGLYAYRDIICRRAVDIIQPDITVAGGFSMLQRIQTLADAHHVRLVPHCWGTALSLAASLHFLATLPESRLTNTPTGPLLEYDRSDNPLRDELLIDNFKHDRGYLPVPQSPGLGVKIDPEQLCRYCVKKGD